MLKKNIKWGDFRSNTPISRNYGFERGAPVDRYFIYIFLEENAHLIKGNCLEIKDNYYTIEFGQSKVTSSDILDINRKNKKATIIADLASKNKRPLKRNYYDCIILTQTLQYIYDIRKALRNLIYGLKVGGYLFITVPFIAQQELDSDYADYWRFTKNSLGRLLLELDKNIKFELESYGNLITCIAFLEGLVGEDLKPSEFKYKDPYYPMVICAKVKKYN